MKKIIFVLIAIFSLFACQKENEVFNFEKVEFKDLRTNPSNWFTRVDLPREIIKYEDRGGWVDTLGVTQLFYDNVLLTTRNWETSYMLSKHGKTNFSYAHSSKFEAIMVLTKPDYLTFDQMFIIYNHVRKEFPVNFITIKLAEIDLDHRILRVVYNNSWARTGDIPDKTEEFNF